MMRRLILGILLGSLAALPTRAVVAFLFLARFARRSYATTQPSRRKMPHVRSLFSDFAILRPQVLSRRAKINEFRGSMSVGLPRWFIADIATRSAQVRSFPESR